MEYPFGFNPHALGLMNSTLLSVMSRSDFSDSLRFAAVYRKGDVFEVNPLICYYKWMGRERKCN